jgi:hypothetical protein
MRARQPHTRWAPCAVILVAPLAVLAGCGPTRNQFAPPCPGRAILGDAADLDVYRGTGHELTDLVVHGRIVGMQGSCREGDRKTDLAVNVSPSVELERGPAMQGRETDVPIFLAVTERETIIDKRVYLVHVVFPSNVDRVTVSPSEVNLVLPVTPTKSGAVYTLLTGFQLSADQLARSPRE